MITMSDTERVWLEKARIAAIPKIRDCGQFLGIVTEDFLNDPVCLLQIGAAVCLGKPLYLLVKKGTKLPGKLIEVVDGVVEFDDQAGGIVAAQTKLAEMLKLKGLL